MTNDIKVLAHNDLRPRVGVVIGTRPGFVMLAPIIRELLNRVADHFVIHTGQHYSPNMDLQFFEDLQLEAPAFRLEGTSKLTTHGAQTAHMLEGIERIPIWCCDNQPFLNLRKSSSVDLRVIFTSLGISRVRHQNRSLGVRFDESSQPTSTSKSILPQAS